MSTPHISANLNDFASTVLFPGDPLRAKYIADKFLSCVKQINEVRNILGYTGEYKGKKVSILASGIGIPSCNIYATELITNYKVKTIIRIGTAGGLKNAKIELNDIILVQGASTDSNVNRIRFKGYDFAATCNFHLLKNAYEMAKTLNLSFKVGNSFTSDFFYTPNEEIYSLLESMGIVCVDMETAGLYGIAQAYNAKALSILTISDIIGLENSLTPKERETGLNDMITLALECAVK